MGDKDLFNALYLEFKDRVYTIARRYLGSRDAALDAAQDVFVRLYEKIKALPAGTERAPYITRMIINRCLDMLRKRRPQEGLEKLEAQNDTAAQAEARDEVDYLLSRLNPDQRLTVILKEIMGHSIEETAKMTGVDEGTVKSRFFRAMEIMRGL